MKVGQQEILAILKLDAFKRYNYLLKRVADFEVLFSLKNDQNHYVTSELDGNLLFPIWSASEFAQSCLLDGWKNCEIVAISLEKFEDEIIDHISRNNLLLNIFPVSNKTGFVVTLDEFVRDLKVELDKY